MPQKQVDDFGDQFAEVVAEVKLIGAQRFLHGLPDIPASRAFATVYAKHRFNAGMVRVMDFFSNIFFQEAQAAPLSDLSLYELGEDAVSLQGLLSASIIPDGYIQFANLLAAGLDIRLGHVVDTVVYGENGVAVTLKDGTTLRAKYAVVTLPLGVLKGGSVNFVPPLPPWKQRSIDRLGFGTTTKIYFRFPSVFWPSDRDAVHRISNTSAGEWAAWFNFFKYSAGPDGQPGRPTLLSFNHGAYGAQLETMSDRQVIDTAYAVLQKEFGGRAQRPIAVQRSSWASDPFARGVIPHTPPGSSSKDYVIMSQPVAGRLFFAGDGTTDRFTGYVLGAYETGIREAMRILHGH